MHCPPTSDSWRWAHIVADCQLCPIGGLRPAEFLNRTVHNLNRFVSGGAGPVSLVQVVSATSLPGLAAGKWYKNCLLRRRVE
jgi:hypothetical protein